jgi:hypothetical protein
MSIFSAKQALEDNLRKHLTSDKHPILWNQNAALMGICDSLERLEKDMELLHRKLQPILKELVEDQHDWQQWTRGE